jgi:hypothetical protein
MRLFGLDLPVPDHTTFSRRGTNLAIASALVRTDGPVTVVIDSTGLEGVRQGRVAPRKAWKLGAPELEKAALGRRSRHR